MPTHSIKWPALYLAPWVLLLGGCQTLGFESTSSKPNQQAAATESAPTAIGQSMQLYIFAADDRRLGEARPGYYIEFDSQAAPAEQGPTQRFIYRD